MLAYPHRLSLANLPTPLRRLEHFRVPDSKARIWIKHDETTSFEASGNKIRKLEFTLAEALAQHCNTVITCGGIQSNHCRATAVLGARLGLQVHLLLRGERPQSVQGNLLLDYLAGATVDYLPQQQWPTHVSFARQLARQYSARGDKALFVPIGASDEIGLWGYVAACEELKQDFARLDLQPDYLVCATGSGGTQGGLAVGAQLFALPCAVVAFNVSDDAAYFDAKIRKDVALWQQRYQIDADLSCLPITTIGDYLGPGYGIATPEVFQLIADLARTEGLFLDPVYTGKAFLGMVSELQKGEQGWLAGARDVVFVHTGGLFGLFPQQAHFAFDKTATTL